MKNFFNKKKVKEQPKNTRKVHNLANADTDDYQRQIPSNNLPSSENEQANPDTEKDKEKD